MRLRRGVSRRGVDLVARFEGFKSCPYRDAVGTWTVGYGHTEGVTRSSKCISRRRARRLLRRELNRKYLPAVRALPTFRRLNQHQVDALVSFVYNVGPGGIAADTQVGKALRSGHFGVAARHLLDWDRAGGKTLAGLTRRREAERHLFLS